MPDFKKIYDCASDQMRDVTQEDIDQGERSTAALGVMKQGLEALWAVTLELAQGKREFTDYHIVERIKSP